MYSGSLETKMRVRLGVKEPERDIDSTDLVDVILALEYAWQELFSGQMPTQSFLCRLFVKLERHHQIRSQIPREGAEHHNGIAAVRTTDRTGVLIADDLAAAGLARVHAHMRGFVRLPLFSSSDVPVHGVFSVLVQSGVHISQSVHLIFGITVRAFHLLCMWVKRDRTAATRALIGHLLIQLVSPPTRNGNTSVRRKRMKNPPNRGILSILSIISRPRH